MFRRRLEPRGKDRRTEELINFRELVGGGLDQLYQSFRRHPERIPLRRAIRFMVGSYTTIGLEQSYFLAYAALDAAIGAASDKRIEFACGGGVFRRLCDSLRATVEHFATEAKIPRLVDDIADKLPELRRRSIRTKMRDLAQKLAIEVDDLWPSVGFDAGFARATKARNDLVHSAKLERPDEIYRDRVRIWTLTERIVLKLLEWSQSRVWVWQGEELRRVNIEEQAPSPDPAA